MPTVEKLLILLRCNWDKVLFHQTGSAANKQLLTDIDRDKYASLRQDLLLAPKKSVAPEYARIVHRQMLATCVDKATAQTFIGYASTL